MREQGGRPRRPRTSRARRIGVTDLGSGTDTLTQLLAAQAGIAKDQFSRIGVGAGSTALAASEATAPPCVMTTQPTVSAIEKKNLGYSAIDLATTDGANKALGGAWPAAGVLARTDWVNKHQEAAQDVVDALVATMHWINTHSAADIANALPRVLRAATATITKADYITALTRTRASSCPTASCRPAARRWCWPPRS